MVDKDKKSPFVKIISLGGVGNVTKNMYVYETERDIVVVDCGVGFPDEAMPGIDLVIPDISYLREKRRKLRAIILTHGHEDHIGALPYILPELNVPVYGTKLTIALAKGKLKEVGFNTDRLFVIKEDIPVFLSDFKIEFVHVTHSVPDAANLIITTPAGVFYHASDFKFDWTPLDNRPTQVAKIAAAGEKGVLCLLSDCLRSEKRGYTLSERTLIETFEREISSCPGKFIVTTQSSNISRIQMAVSAAVKHNRKICFLGRSIEKAVSCGMELGYLSAPKEALIIPQDIPHHRPDNLCLIAAGSQGQPESALSRIAGGENELVKIKDGDVVVFSTDIIPGNENAFHSLIDMLTKQGARVAYSEILDDLHVSGHAAQNELSLMIGLTRPKFLLPIGGTFRHMKQYSVLAEDMGFKKETILLTEDGQTAVFSGGQARLEQNNIGIKNIMVDGLGIGDVGSTVLRDRQVMAADGIVVVIVPINRGTGLLVSEPDIISRGFVYMKESGELIAEAKNIVKKSFDEHAGRPFEWHFLRRRLEDTLEDFLWKKTRRRPMILPVVMEA
ncbi:MAG: ribonuclease J [bacterium]|nr:ribonuclease J [bacterium]